MEFLSTHVSDSPIDTVFAIGRSVFVTLPMMMILLLVSCNDDTYTVAPEPKFTYEKVPFNEKGKLMEKFGLGISKAMQYPEFRQLIKQEALKRFNKDTDVLYPLIRDVPINASAYFQTGEAAETLTELSTLHDFLIPFFGSEEALVAAENALPLLTIFVPTLPNDSFSAELWDVNDEQQIPDVALALDNISFVPVIGRDEENYLIEPGYAPGYPIVVIKENERVISSKHPHFNELDTRIISTSGTAAIRMNPTFDEDIPNYKESGVDYELRFYDDNFDLAGARTGATQGSANGYRGASDDYIPDYLIRAYDLFKDADRGWQRDNIYYGLTPDNTTGRFIGSKYRETITTIKIVGTDLGESFKKLSDSYDEVNRDPALVDGWWRNKYSFTEGSFELEATVHIGQRSADAGISITRAFPLSPESLFEIEWEQKSKGWWIFTRRFYKPRIKSAKTVNTAIPGGIRWEFPEWNLEENAVGWRIDWRERDKITETTYEQSWPYYFNANMKLSEDGFMEKVGLEFGADYQQSSTNKLSVKVIDDNDEIATGYTISFHDNVVEYYGGKYHLRKFHAGMVEFSFVPVQVKDF